jgi:hypothetical protein
MFPIAQDFFAHRFHCSMQPLPIALFQVFENPAPYRFCSKVNISGFPTHRLEQLQLIAGPGDGPEFNPAASRSKPPDQPPALNGEARIGHSNGVGHDGLV